MTPAPPFIAWPADHTASPVGAPPRTGLARRFLQHPVTAICAVQAGLSLSLIWSNTAFADEAQYLASGKLEWDHWLHGSAIPTYLTSTLSGSPALYPPLGALADDFGGLAGARVLSLLFMLAATVLLYGTALRLFGRNAAIIGAALWALSEPAIRLAFATFDPLSVLLTALSAFLVVRAGYGRRRIMLAASAAAILALANATAYSGIIIDPVIIAFAFLVWLPLMRIKQAALHTTAFSAFLLTFFSALIAASGSWSGLESTVINRSGTDHQSVLLVLSDSWGYSGLIAVLAAIGVVAAFGAESRNSALLMTLLGVTALVVPAAQFREQTAWSLDKHLAYGILFAAIAAGYGCSTLIQWLPGVRRELAVFFCAIAFIYPTANSWESAWSVYHAWPDAGSYITKFKPIAAHNSGIIDITETGPENVAEYYTPQGGDWKRWTAALPLDPAGVPQKDWTSHYLSQLRSGKYGVIALFYGTTFSSAPYLPGSFVLSPPPKGANQEFLGYVAKNSGQPGLPALTQALQHDADYKLVASGPYNSAHQHSIFAIWVRRPHN